MRILLEGRPGIGKSTVARRLAELLGDRGATIAGFVTDELREGGRRVGFAVETFEGERAVLAHVKLAGPPRVSRYGVDVETFERVALPTLRREADVFVVDEIGKMELASAAFRKAAAELFEGRAVVVATVQLARHPFTDELKRRRGVEVIRVGLRNRQELPRELAARLGLAAN